MGARGLPRAPGLPEKGGTDPQAGKGHACLAKLPGFSESLSHLGIPGQILLFRSLLTSSSQEETTFLHLDFSNHFSWVCITFSLPVTF